MTRKKHGTGPKVPPESYLQDDTSLLERSRHTIEQQGHRQYATVHAKEHPKEDAPRDEDAQQHVLKENPWLDSQRFDGIDPNMSPAPLVNTEARREFDNLRREQEMEKQLRLGLAPGPRFKPKPQGP